MNRIYLNTKTGEVTTNHREAVEWFRQGVTVEIKVETNGKFETRLVWEAQEKGEKE